MFLSRLELRNFRNIESQDLNLTKGITVLWGDNGEGKTNLIESIYFLSYTRPLLRNGFSQLIRRGSEEAHVRGVVKSEGHDLSLSSSLKRRGGVTSFRNGKRSGLLRDYVGGLIAVAFVTSDIQGIFGMPGGRRRFLDQTAAIRRPMHVDLLMEYTKCLRQRNRLLLLIREGSADQSLLAPFDEKLCGLAEELTARRVEVLAGMRGKFQEYFSHIDGGEDVDIGGEGISFSRVSFEDMRSSDLKRGVTQYGPHRGDFKVTVGGKDGRFYASQGKRRVAAISLKLAQAKMIEDVKGAKPLLLLDDITSEIDPGRRKRLLSLIEKMSCQTLVTTTSAALLEEGFSGKITAIRIQKGKIM